MGLNKFPNKKGVLRNFVKEKVKVFFFRFNFFIYQIKFYSKNMLL